MHKTFDTKKYWDNRLSSHLNIQGTGHRSFGIRYNHWLYQAQIDCLNRLFSTQKITLAEKKILDVGSGTGFFINYFLEQGVQQITGLDLSDISVEYLKATFPKVNFYRTDISELRQPIGGPFDLITAISVIYHIVDDKQFEQALTNLCSLCAPGGYVIINDVFVNSKVFETRHVRTRSLKDYKNILLKNNFEILELVPMYYLLNRSFIPIFGPFIINILNLGKLFYSFDKHMRNIRRGNGKSLKLLLAKHLVL